MKGLYQYKRADFRKTVTKDAVVNGSHGWLSITTNGFGEVISKIFIPRLLDRAGRGVLGQNKA